MSLLFFTLRFLHSTTQRLSVPPHRDRGFFLLYHVSLRSSHRSSLSSANFVLLCLLLLRCLSCRLMFLLLHALSVVYGRKLLPCRVLYLQFLQAWHYDDDEDT